MLLMGIGEAVAMRQAHDKVGTCALTGVRMSGNILPVAQPEGI